MEFYNKVSEKCSKVVTNAYSTSFSLGIWSLPKKYHKAIYSVYGFVRLADEIVDTFHQKDKATLLKAFKIDTFKAIDEKISLNPILNAFQNVVNRFNIKKDWIEAFLFSMEMDLTKTDFTQEEYEKYIYGSAEVVGLMCLQIFCDGNDAVCEKLIPQAKSLGAAFQKVNFLRDIKSDFEERGRVYFPKVDFNNFSNGEKIEIEKDINLDFKDAFNGIKKLPNGSKLGVLATYVYYSALFNKIKNQSVEKLKNNRIRINNFHKFWLLLRTTLQVRLGLV